MIEAFIICPQDLTDFPSNMKDLAIDCDYENKGTIDSVDLIRVIEGKCE